jgi:transposase
VILRGEIHMITDTSVLFDKFHVMRHLGEALDQVRKSEYARPRGKDRSVIKGQKYTLLSHRENLTLDGRRSLHKLLRANQRFNVAYLLKESFGQLWDYRREVWAGRFFENWKAALRWQRLKPYQTFVKMIDRHWGRDCRVLPSPTTKSPSASSRVSTTKSASFDAVPIGLRDEE